MADGRSDVGVSQDRRNARDSLQRAGISPNRYNQGAERSRVVGIQKRHSMDSNIEGHFRRKHLDFSHSLESDEEDRELEEKHQGCNQVIHCVTKSQEFDPTDKPLLSSTQGISAGSSSPVEHPATSSPSSCCSSCADSTGKSIPLASSGSRANHYENHSLTNQEMVCSGSSIQASAAGASRPMYENLLPCSRSLKNGIRPCNESSLDQAFAQLAKVSASFDKQLDHPPSMALDDDQNRVMRIPARTLQECKTQELNAMLKKIGAHPEQFALDIEQRRQRDAMIDPTPSRLEDFKVHSIAGRGSFSTVYVATRRSDGNQFALKRVKLTGVESEQSKTKSVKEIRVLQSLQHPNIIKCYEHFHTPEGLFIVLEWAVAGDLKRMLKRVRAKQSRFHERVIWNYFAQISCALAYMHEHRMIHRDIKPANVFIMPDGRIKLGDLGLSRALSQATVRAYSKVGTPLYMAPEVLQGAGHDFKSDIWSLGCLLYELAMLHSPFEVGCKTMKSLFTRILRAEYFPLSHTYSDIFHEVVASIFLIDPENRPTAQQILDVAQARVHYYEHGPEVQDDDPVCSLLHQHSRRAFVKNQGTKKGDNQSLDTKAKSLAFGKGIASRSI